MPVSACRRLSSFRYCSWIVTSSAVVGSSAISTPGSPLMAIAPTTRCFMPPLIWCGYWPMRCSGAAISTRRSAATASFITSARGARLRRRIASRNWSPIVNTGLSEVCGSCSTIEMRRPRISRISAGVRSRMFSPSSSTSPLMVRAPPFGSRRISDSAVRLLPQPDSPTRPSTSPRRSEKLTPSTAFTTPRRRKKWVCRSRTSRTVSPIVIAGAASGRAGRAANRRTG